MRASLLQLTHEERLGLEDAAVLGEPRVGQLQPPLQPTQHPEYDGAQPAGPSEIRLPL